MLLPCRSRRDPCSLPLWRRLWRRAWSLSVGDAIPLQARYMNSPPITIVLIHSNGAKNHPYAAQFWGASQTLAIIALLTPDFGGAHDTHR